jgi:hypothetical protein
MSTDKTALKSIKMTSFAASVDGNLVMNVVYLASKQEILEQRAAIRAAVEAAQAGAANAERTEPNQLNNAVWGWNRSIFS